MNEKPGSVEEKIILTTIECIEKYGISGATNRQIAQMAGVNLAAINYYFRSKEILIQRCMEITLKNAFDLGEFSPMLGIPAAERCIAIMLELIEGGLHYPGISRAHFYNLLAEGQYDPLLVTHLNRFVEELAIDLHTRECALEDSELKMALIQIVSAVLFAVLAPALFEKQHRMDLHDPLVCRAYITRLVNKLLA